MSQVLILVTGHICSGKSSLYKELNKIKSLEKVDIADVNKMPSAFSTTRDFFYQEKRLYYLCEKIYSLMYQKKSVYIELLGEESWFSKLRDNLSKSWLPLIQIELQRESLNMALECLEYRCFKSNIYKSQTQAIKYFDGESMWINENYGFTFNPKAKKYITNKENCKQIAREIWREYESI